MLRTDRGPGVLQREEERGRGRASVTFSTITAWYVSSGDRNAGWGGGQMSVVVVAGSADASISSVLRLAVVLRPARRAGMSSSSASCQGKPVSGGCGDPYQTPDPARAPAGSLDIRGIARVGGTGESDSGITRSRRPPPLRGSGPAESASYVTNSVGNSSIIAVGVIGQKDGVYKVPGKYDERLQPQMWSHSQFGWNTTGGWYTGPGYCTAQMRSDDHGKTWRDQLPDLGPGVHLIGPNTSYALYAYPC